MRMKHKRFCCLFLGVLLLAGAFHFTTEASSINELKEEQKKALEDILHFTAGAKMQTAFDDALFTRFVQNIIVYSRTEIGFAMKCGPVFRERI